MAIIYSYPTVTPASGDLLIGTDITGKVTKNFTVGSIVSTEIPTYITGTTNTVPLFTGANTIGNSIITQNTNGDKVIIGGSLNLNGPVTSSLSSDRLNEISLNVVDAAQGNAPDYFLISLGSSGEGSFYAKTLELGDGESAYGGAVFNIDSPNSKFLFNNGNVGIGIATPGYKLSVDGDISLVGGGENYGIMSPISQGMQIAVGDGASVSSPLVTFAGTNQRVGIGTTSPSAKLSVNGKATVNELEVAGASVAGSQLTSLAVKTSAGTEVNTWIDMTATPTSNATGDAYGAVIRAVGSGSNTDRGLIGVNPVGRQSGTGGAQYAYGVLATGEQTGSGNIDFIVGVDSRASSSGNGTATTDYLRGINADAKVNNSNATVDYLQGIHAAANLTTGTVGEVNVNLLDWDYTAGTVTGDLSYIRIQNDNYTGVAGTARAIHSLAQLPSLFSGTVEVAGGDLEASTSTKGLVLKSPDGTRYRVTIANGGTLSVSAV